MNLSALTTLTVNIGMGLILTSNANAQNWMREVNGISIREGGVALEHPFLGGFGAPKIQFVDMDGDGDEDIVLLDGIGSLQLFNNIGTPESSLFEFVTDKYLNIEKISWFQFLDIDNDGDNDLFTSSPGSQVAYYKNTGTVFTPLFELAADTLIAVNGEAVTAVSLGVPTFADIDSDGDFDFFTMGAVGSICFYENLGQDGSELPILNFVTCEFGDIFIFLVTCGNQTSLQQTQGHGSAAFHFNDIDDDGDLDLFWGDDFNGGIYYLRNNGTPFVPVLALTDTLYPRSNPILTSGFNRAQFVDIDNDGDQDLSISSLGGFCNVDDINVLQYYENVGVSSIPIFEQRTTRFLSNLDVGSHSILTFGDINGDGTQDLIVATDLTGVDFNGELSLYLNTGSSNAPSFELVARNFLNIDLGLNYAPALVDIDGDDDLDLFLGEWEGNLNFFENRGSSSNADFVLTNTNYLDIDVGNNSLPVFVDIDADDDLDLFIGEKGGNLNYWENVGNSILPDFVFRSAEYGGIDVGEYSVPNFFDEDGDGDFDLLIGRGRDGSFNLKGDLLLYRNAGTQNAADFILAQTGYADVEVSSFSAPMTTDIDNDGDEDLFVGTKAGGALFYRNLTIVGVEDDAENTQSVRSFHLAQNYPNPFNPTTQITFSVPGAGFVSLTIYDIRGELVKILLDKVLPAGNYSEIFDGANLSSGIYFYRLKRDELTETKKMLLLK